MLYRYYAFEPRGNTLELSRWQFEKYIADATAK